MAKLPLLPANAVIKALQKMGFEKIRQEGSREATGSSEGEREY